MQKLEFILKIFGFISKTSEMGRSFVFSFISFALLLSLGIYSYHFNTSELKNEVNNYILNKMDVEMNMDFINAIRVDDKTGDENDIGILMTKPKYILIRKEKNIYSEWYNLHIIILKNSGD